MHPFLAAHVDGDDAPPFTRRAAHAAGVSDHALSLLVSEGRLRRPLHGTYVTAGRPDDTTSRAEALRLVVPRGCFLCDETAAFLHGADGAAGSANDDLRTHVVRCFRPAEAGRLRRTTTDSGERTLLESDLMEVAGLVTTTPLRTALDLGRLRPRGRALAAMDALARVGDFGAPELVAELPRLRRQRGVVQLRQLAPLVDRGAQSPPESILRLAWYDARLPPPETQIEVVLNGVSRFLDLGTRKLRFAAEYDGVDFHADPEQVRDDLERRRLFSERRWHIEVFSRADLAGPAADPVGRLIRTFHDHVRRTRPGHRL